MNVQSERPGAQHPALVELVEYIEGNLSPAERARVEAHLQSECAACRDEVAALRLTAELLR
ncbi:MAG: zf-HC2 domain-containing protein, partial [Candidatus Promineifilaceae bacterium]|nr:zf-HC2 domain-containing protein [Candidatus Promineifilaceae bacterium]